MTEISNMVTYYNNPFVYGRPQQNVAQSPPISQPSVPSISSHQSPAPLHEASQQQFNSWCSPYHHNNNHHHHHHHHQQQQAQYLEAEAAMPALWTAHSREAYLHYQHQQAAAYQQQQQQQQQQQHHQAAAASARQQLQPLDWNGADDANNNNNNGLSSSEQSPPITGSGSEISSPGTPASPTANNNANCNNDAASQLRSPNNKSPYAWMKQNTYEPATDVPGKTRTKEKYRVVYTEHQRLELEKEFYSSKYITIRRKAELAATLALSERQVKIWFQNRRAKERKQTKKLNELGERDIKPILEAHGVARALPNPLPAPINGMANLSLCNNMNMASVAGVPNVGINGMMSIMPSAPSPTNALMHHHHHHHNQSLIGAAVVAVAAAQQQHHHQQQHHSQNPGLFGPRTK